MVHCKSRLLPFQSRRWSCQSARTEGRRLAASASLGLAGVVLFAFGLSAQPTRELLLDETARIEIPRGVAIAGAEFGANDDVYLWGSSGIWVWRANSTVLEPLCKAAGSGILAVQWRAVARELAIVGSDRPHLFSYSNQRGCHAIGGASATAIDSMFRHGIGERIIEISDEVLLVFERRPNQRASITSISLATGSARVNVTSASARFGKPGYYVASLRESTLWLTERTFPFRSVRLSPDGTRALSSDPMLGIARNVRAEFVEGWFAVGLTPVPPAYLLVLAQPGSDKRAFATLDRHGRAITIKQLDVAMGVLSSRTSPNTLIVIRDVGEREVVRYRWRWRSGTL